MENKEIETKNEMFILKIKRYEKKMPFRRKDINSSILKDYDKIYQEIYDEMINIEGKKAIIGRFLILVIPHPELKDIYIYSKDQWDLYYNYNIIENCKSNKSLKIEYLLINNSKPKDVNLKNNIKKCRKAIIKYIIKTIPCEILFNILIKFLEKNEVFAEQLKEYMITDLIYNYKKDERDSNESLDENININKIINYDEKKETNKNIDYKELEKIYKGYYIDNKEYINSLNYKFNEITKFNKFQKSFNEIKNILNEDEEKNKKDSGQNKKVSEQNKIDIEEDKYTCKSSIELQNGKSLENLIYSNSSINFNNDNVLQSVLNPSSKFVQDLMENDNFFKKYSKDEYYNGIEDYKDQINRESYIMLNKNNY